MTKPGNGRAEQRAGAPMNPERTFPLIPRTPERAFLICSALTVVSFLSHFFFLILVDPWRVLQIPKEDALAYSTIPLGFSVVFLLAAIYSFIRIESKSMFYVIIFIVPLIFGSFSLHGLFGFIHHYLNIMVLESYPR